MLMRTHITYIVLGAVLIGLVLLLAGCSDGGKTTFGTSASPKLEAAKDMIRGKYPDAAAMPAVEYNHPDGYYGFYSEGVGYYSTDLVNNSTLYLGCSMVHEYEHHLQYLANNNSNTTHGTAWRDIAEQEATNKQNECMRTLG